MILLLHMISWMIKFTSNGNLSKHSFFSIAKIIKNYSKVRKKNIKISNNDFSVKKWIFKFYILFLNEFTSYFFYINNIKNKYIVQ